MPIYAMGSPRVGFFCRVEHPIIYILYMFCVCSGVCFLLLGAELDAVFTYGGLTLWGLHLGNPLEFTHGRHMCNLVMVIGPHLVCIKWLLPLLPWVGWSPSATHSAVPLPIGGIYGLEGSIESHLIPPPSLHHGEGSSFPGLVPSDDTVDFDSVMGIKPGDSGGGDWVSG